MVHACILARANLYEVPRPPRRGSHRPGPPVGSPHHYPALNDYWTDSPPYHGFYYHDRGQGSRLEPLEPFPLRGLTRVGFPDDDDLWKRGRLLLPARRSGPRSLVCPQGRSSLSVGVDHGNSRPSRYDPSPSTSSDTSLPRETAHSNTVLSRARMHQLHGRTPDRDALEQSILESYARAAPQSAACQSTQKRCVFPACAKISVSRGLCRGHGGGRRCHVPGCTKSAQSRSNFCWAHGGGQRCDVEGCMRSRKSKHFCVAHLDMEGATDHNASGAASPTEAPATATTTTDHRTTAYRSGAAGSATKKTSTSRAASRPVRALPSLGQALSSASRSAPNLPARSIKQLLSV